MLKASEISEDAERRAEGDLQELTDNFIKNADELYQHKEQEIMEV
jgi:ribosome recycling factor